MYKFIFLVFICIPMKSFSEVDFKYGPVKNFEIPPAMNKGLEFRDNVHGNYNLYPTDRDSLQALIWLAEKGNADANYILGQMYYDPRLPEKERNTEKGVLFLQKAIDIFPRHGPALYILGGAYLRGEGVKKDVRKALALYEKAGDSGVASGYSELSKQYLYGWDVPRNLNKAKYFNEKAANLGYSEALLMWLNWDYMLKAAKQ